MSYMIQAAYTNLRDGIVARTVVVAEDIMIDVDAKDHILGVETLSDVDWRDGLVILAMAGRLTIPKRGEHRP